MTRDEIVLTIYNDKSLKSLANRMVGDYGQDLIHYVIECLCRLNHEVLLRLYMTKRLNNYVFGIMRNSAMSQRSEWSKKFGSQMDISIETFMTYYSETTPDEPIQSDQFDISDFIEFCRSNSSENFYNQLAAKVALEYCTYTPKKKRSLRDFQKVTGIHYSSTCQYLKIMRTEFEKHYESINSITQ